MKNLLPCLCVFVMGCLTTSHRIPNQELYALAQKDPATRGQAVRVVQNMGGQEAPDVYAGGRVTNNTVFFVNSPVWVGGTPRYYAYDRYGYGNRRGGLGNPGAPVGPATLGKRTGGVAKSEKDEAVILLVLAGIAAGGLALTEGLRYDGWLSVNPMHPVHLYGRGGEYTWMPLADITPQVAAWTRRAYVRSDEGPVLKLGRAPLNRRGFNYNFYLGAGEVALIQGGSKEGFQSHIELGFFPTQNFGILWDLGFGWTQQIEDGIEDDIVFEKRSGLNLQYFPLAVGKLHGGLYGTVGGTTRADDFFGSINSDIYLGGGALLQLELTTRMALTGRLGITNAYNENLSEFLLGISIY